MRNSTEAEEILKKIKWKPGKIIAIVIIIIIGIILVNLVGYKNNTELIVKQGLFGGMSCVEGEGFYWKGLAKTFKYDKTKPFYFNSSTEKVKGEGWEGDDTDEDNIKVTLSRNANAEISAYLMYELPMNCEDLIKIHMYQHSESQVKHNLVRNAVLSAVKKTAPLFTAEEAKVTKIAEFRLIAQEQLENGEYLTVTETIAEKAGEDELDTNGQVIKKAEMQEYRITKLKLDSNGQRIITKKSALKDYGIIVKQFDIQDVTLDSLAQAQLDIVKKREMQRVAKQTEAETAKQDAITAEARGRANVAQAKADQEVEKITAVTKAEKERDVARLNLEKAKLQADSVKIAGESQAEANKAKVKAGLTPQEQAEWDYKTSVGIAQAIAASPQKWVPDNVVVVNGDGGSKGNINPLEPIAVRALHDLVKDMKNK